VKIKKSWKLILLSFLIVAPLVQAGEEQIIKEGVAIRMPRQYQRSLLAIDPVEALMAAGQWKAPKPGDSLSLSNSETAKWDAVSADANVWFTGPAVSDGYVYARVRSDKERVMILNGLGDVYVFVNGELRMGGKYAVKDTYESWEPHFDYGQVPVLFKKGDNHFLFRCTRGRLKAVLREPAAPVLLNEKDVTAPDLLAGGPVLVGKGFVKAGGKRIEGTDLACFFLRPRADSGVACVGVVAGTGVQGMRLTNTRPYLSAGYALPDMIVFNADVGKGGGRGTKLAGFFGLDWGIESGEFISE